MWLWLVVLFAAAIVALWGPVERWIREAKKKRYFASEEFLACKTQLAAVVAEHNEVTRYAAEIRNRGLFRLGGSSTGVHSHLAQSHNTSNWNYRRDRNVANFAAPHVHNCSLQIVRSANADPLKYLMKYFQISATEPTLTEVETLGESIASLENAVGNLAIRERAITQSINPPEVILRHFKKEFMDQVGVELAPVYVPYPVYVFEYVSAGGNSSQRTTVTLNTGTIDALVETINRKIRWQKSAAGQRALMTAKLRDFIKTRDDFTCQQCGISVHAEPHLLLEVDHIVPVSRGGLSTVPNLQTLCWRCNRRKSNKVPG